MPRYTVPIAILPGLAHAMHIFKLGIPSRFEKVAKYMATFTEANPSTMTSSCVQVIHFPLSISS